MIFGGVVIGYQTGVHEKDMVHDNLTFLLESERNLEVVQNIKALSGLRENENETIIEFMHVRVKSNLKMDGIKDTTIERARIYQKKYCKDACLGVK